MENNLIIVESPAKAKTIKKFLGKDFLVKSSFGHIRDLEKKNFGIEIENNYRPQYVISEDKKKIVSELRKSAKNVKIIWLAPDEDREGEAIAWHLFEVLKLKPDNTKRIVFHEITKNAIQNAINNPRNIDKNLVDAQQARRILDRMVGFKLSPVLWEKIKPALSAGRVQSVAVRLLVEREREIIAFKSKSAFKVTAIFEFLDKNNNKVELKAELPKKLETKEQALDFLNKCKNAEFEIEEISTKPLKKSPSPPFTTSTLQQEASRKLGFSVSQTMAVAQKLYEAGKITYMRTDSVNLSNIALTLAKKAISDKYGMKYSKSRKYKTKTKGAQEAHEAIRPTYLENKSVSGSNTEQRLYELIWKRTIASQMSDALLEKTTVIIRISTMEEKLIASGEVLKFDGFLKVYKVSAEEEDQETSKGLLPPLKMNQKLSPEIISATEKFTNYPPRYTEGSLVKKLEELGIGRPSTYVPIISTIQNRGYVVKEDRPGKEREYVLLSLINNTIKKETRIEIAGVEKSKMFPNDIGMVVNDFLVEHFKDILNFNFTASVEKEFDEIAAGKIVWTEMIDKFYRAFHKKVEKTMESSEWSKGERELGTDPKSKKIVTVKIGRYGPVAQLGKSGDAQKPKFASLLKGQHIETIILEEALDLFKLPRILGKYENKDITIGVGRFGPYVMHNSKFYSLQKETDDPFTIKMGRAIEIIEDKREEDRKKVIKTFEENHDLKILKGRWGPYISFKKENFKIPKNKDAKSLSLQNCLDLIKNRQKSKAKTPKIK